MARNHGRIAASMWSDPDFIALPVTAQRLYMFLLSQPNLSHLGVLPLTERRWAKSAAGLTVEDVRADLAILEERRYVVIDEETEELLIRTLMRNDNVYKQPNTLRAARASLLAVGSQKIRQAIRAEVLLISLDDIEDGKRDGIRADLKAIADAIGEPIDIPSGNPSTGDAGTPSEAMPDAPTYARARPLPLAPAPTNSSAPAVLALAAEPDPFDEFWDLWPRKIEKKPARLAYAKAVKQASPDVILAGARRYVAEHERKGTAKGYLKHAASWLNAERWNDEPDAAPNTGFGYTERAVRTVW